MGASEKLSMSCQEFVAFEAASDIKHEYLRGEVFAMAGGTPEHAALQASLGGELRQALRGRPCRVFSADLKVRVVETDLFTYPDLSVVCGKLERAPGDDNAIVNPTLLVEVLSDSSEAYDRGEKFAHYRRIPSLRDYVLVSQRAPRMEVFSRNGATRQFTEAGPGEVIALPSLEIAISVDEVYRDPLADPAR
ncbi:MAG: Uma2 family endonuclease [Myxococcales bacterium]|nr:Uma2 family endonuclease [Myxococcales bacterium]